MTGQPAGYMRVAELLMGSRITRALDVVVDRGIADLIGDGVMSAEEMEAGAGMPAASVRRLLRALSYVGVFVEHADGRFSNSDASTYLRKDHSPTLREMSLALNDSTLLKGWE